MIAHHDDRRSVAISLVKLAHHGVELLIQPVNVPEVLLRLSIGTNGVFVVGGPPENVRLQVAARKVKEQQAVFVVVDGVFKQGQPFFQHQVGLLQEFIVAENAVFAGIVIFLKAGGVEQTQPARHAFDKRARLRQLRGALGSTFSGVM